MRARQFDRRQVLTASAALTALAVSGCEPLDVAEGKTPTVSLDVRTLQAAIAAEQDLIGLYNRTMSAYSGLSSSLAPLLAEHTEHLARLKATVSYPAGYKASPSASPRPAAVAGTRAAAVGALRSAESAAAAGQLDRLAAVGPSNAQLLASIAASELTHAAVLP